MSIRANTFSFLKRVLISRVGHLLVVINLCFIIYEYSQISATLDDAGGSCVTVSEAQNSDVIVCTYFLPLWFKIVVWLKSLSLIPTEIISTFLQTLFPTMCIGTATQIQTVLLAAFGSVQWLFVGYFVESIARKHLWKRRRI